MIIIAKTFIDGSEIELKRTKKPNAIYNLRLRLSKDVSFGEWKKIKPRGRLERQIESCNNITDFLNFIIYD